MAISGGLLLTGASGAFSSFEQRKTRKSTEKQLEKSEDKAAAAVDEAKAAEATEIQVSEAAKRKRAKDLTTGGRAAQFKTGPLGVQTRAPLAKKTLLGA